MRIFWDTMMSLWNESGFVALFSAGGWKSAIMLAVSCVLIYLAIKRQYEPLLLLPIAFGMLLANLPFVGMMDYPQMVFEPISSMAEGAHFPVLELMMDDGTKLEVFQNLEKQVNGGLFYYLYQGVKLGIFPPLIFLGIGAMTDFGPLIANPKSFLLGAAAQLGIFGTFVGAIALSQMNVLGLSFTGQEAGAIAIIGGADGPTSIYVAGKLAPHLLGTIAIAAYSYMAMVPVIQPPIMRALTTKKERSIVMTQLRTVSKLEKIVFPILVTILVSLLVPSSAPLLGMLMLGNLMRESGVVDRLVKTAQNELMNIVTIFLGLTVGATATAEQFLNPQALGIIVLGLLAFSLGTAGGVLFGKLMCWWSRGKVNPLIGAAGVSAVPMAARVAQKVGAEENPSNFLLMHAMGPNVSGVIGSAVAAGVLLRVLGS